MRHVEFVPFRLTEVAEISNQGSKESFFRPEGKMNDRLCAIPIYTYNSKNRIKDDTLRLYCIRLSDKLVIIGNGGVKTTQTYEEDENLSKHVQTLQAIDAELSKLERDGKDLQKEIYNLTLQIN